MLDNHERRILDETERQLAQDDPALDDHFRHFTLPPVRGREVHRRRPRLPTWLVLSILTTVAVVLLALPALVTATQPSSTPAACVAATGGCSPAPSAAKTADVRTPAGAVP